jgi:tmRNA-binding protein
MDQWIFRIWHENITLILIQLYMENQTIKKLLSLAQALLGFLQHGNWREEDIQ